jgi:hypothetical protein
LSKGIIETTKNNSACLQWAPSKQHAHSAHTSPAHPRTFSLQIRHIFSAFLHWFGYGWLPSKKCIILIFYLPLAWPPFISNIPTKPTACPSLPKYRHSRLGIQYLLIARVYNISVFDLLATLVSCNFGCAVEAACIAWSLLLLTSLRRGSE